MKRTTMSTPITYTLSTSEDGTTSTLTVFIDGRLRTVPDTHSNFRELVNYLVGCSANGEQPDHDTVAEYLDLLVKVGSRLTSLSERVRVQGSTLYFDNDPVEGPLADHILRLIEEGDEEGWKPFVKFMENLAQNPSRKSREALFEFLIRYKMTITPDGHFIAYKGVVPRSGEDTLYLYSVSSGRAIVNGVVHKGQIPNPLGAIVEMPRSKVNPDNYVGCSYGLHAGTWEYASEFVRGRGKILIVKINPRDVVSVPNDCAYQKIRVSRYQNLSIVENPLTTATYYGEFTSNEDEDTDYCVECGDEFPSGDMIEEEGNLFCEDCHDEVYSPCSDCGESYYVDDLDEEGECEDCAVANAEQEDEDEDGPTFSEEDDDEDKERSTLRF